MTIQSLRGRSLLLFAATFALLLASRPTRAAEGGSTDAEEARAYHEKAKAAFALSHYAQAAEFFEKAFELKSDPALLYNAAQSHRLAGNKQRALTLYQNYLHVYGRDERRAQIEMRIEELKKAIEKDRTEVPASPPAGWPPGATAGAAGSKAGASSPPSLRAAEPTKPLPLAPPAAPPSPPPAPAPAVTPPAPIALAPMPATAPPAAIAPPPPSTSSSPTLLTQSSTNGEGSGNGESSITSKPWFWVAIGGGVAAAATVVLLLTLSKAKDPSASFGQINGN